MLACQNTIKFVYYSHWSSQLGLGEQVLFSFSLFPFTSVSSLYDLKNSVGDCTHFNISVTKLADKYFIWAT